MRIAVDVQHRGKPTSLNDRGAVNSDGVEEVTVTSLIADALDACLRKQGHQVMTGMAGDYSDRHKFVNLTSMEFYFALHMNSGINKKRDYGLVLYDYRSTKGKDAADKLATELTKALGYEVRSVSCRPDTNSIARDGDYTEAFNCIAGVRCPALCLEPGFMDGLKVQPILRNPDTRREYCNSVASTIASTLFDWI